MGLKIFTGISFRDLEQCLLDRVARAALDDPFQSRWILTSTADLAARVRVEIARSAARRPIAGVRVLPFSALVGRLLTLTEEAGSRWSSAHDLVLHGLVRSLDNEWILSRLLEQPQGYSRLIPILMDLADAGFGEETEELLLEVAAEPDFPEVAAEVLILYNRWIRCLGDYGLAWQPVQAARLAFRLEELPSEEVAGLIGCGPGVKPQLDLLGFYDFTDVNLEILAALSQKAEVSLYLPHLAGHSGFRFTEEVMAELTMRCPPDDVIPVERSADSTASTFFLATFPEGERLPRPEFLTIQRVSGLHAEAIAAAVRIRLWLDEDPNLEYHHAAVLVPDVSRYYPFVRKAFAHYGLPIVVSDLDLGPTGRSRPLVTLRRLIDEEVPAEWLLLLLRDEEQVAVRFGLDLDRLELKLRDEGLYGGDDWRRLRERAEADPESWSEQERRLISEVCDDLLSAGTADDPWDAFRRLGKWLADSTLLTEMASRAADLELEGQAGLTVLDLIDLVIRVQSGERRFDRLDQDGVLLTSVMRARGIVTSHTILLGLSADNYPPRVEEEPLLPDAVRAALSGKARILGHRLRPKSRASREMTLLFLLLNNSARRLHWVVPETDEHGKSVAPTPWVQRYMLQWGESGVGEEWRLPRSPLGQARKLRDLDRLSGRFLPPPLASLLKPESPAFQRVPSEYPYLQKARACRRRDCAWNGWMKSAALGSPGWPDRVTVTGLEALTRCPFRFWAEVVAGLRSLEPMGWVDGLTPLQRGWVIHQALQHLIEPLVRSKSPLRRGIGQLRQQLQFFRRSGRLESMVAAASPHLPPILRRQSAENAMSALAAYLDAVEVGNCGDGVPLGLEIKKRRILSDSVPLLISGKADRLDCRDGRLWVVDYKSGRNVIGQEPEKNVEIVLGFRLQPLLYPWLLIDADEKGGFSYVFLGGNQPEEVSFQVGDPPEIALRGVVELLQQGSFFPISDSSFARIGIPNTSPCFGCGEGSLCRRDEEGASMRWADFLRLHAPARWEEIQRVLEEGAGDG